MNDVSTPTMTLIDETTVAEYLKNHPDFFERHPQLLANLHINQGQQGAVSLVQRQQSLQRERIQQLEEEITQLMGLARGNEKLFHQFSHLFLALMRCTSESQLIATLREQIKNQFNLVDVFMLSIDSINALPELTAKSLKKTLDHRLSNQTYYFGRLNKDEIQQLFPGLPVGSVAMMKVVSDTTAQNTLGYIAFGSRDEHHYAPNMDTLFLDSLKEIIAFNWQQFLSRR